MFRTLRSTLLTAAAFLSLAMVQAVPSTVCAEREVPGAGDARHGQWFLDPGSKGDAKDNLRFSLRRVDGDSWQSWGSDPVSIEDLEGLTPQDFGAGSHGVTFRVRRDGGTFVCRGSIDGRRGAGTFELELDPDFAAELERRGLGVPTEEQQVRLVMANAGIALLDELKTQGYDRPDLPTLLKMADHGVRLEYVRGMGALGYRLGSLGELVRARDHGVDPWFVRGLAEAGFKNLPFERLLTVRDHGVDPTFIAYYRSIGYGRLTLDELLTLRDHGVDGSFIEGMRSLGFRNLSLDQLRSARDHGVDPHYVAEMAEAGFKNLALADLMRARDHGVDGSFARLVRERRGGQVPLEEMIELRDRGLTR